MTKKILVPKEWHSKAVLAIQSEYKNAAFVDGLKMFLLTKLTPDQQIKLEKEIEEFMNQYKDYK